ncbi:MAG: hypothetical protein ABJB40_11615, partial [Acidobacteriota bacterium]
MNTIKLNYRRLLSLPLAIVLGLFISQTGISQTEKLGTVGFTAPANWNKTTKENIVAFSKVDEKTGTFCIITLYGATPGTGKPASDFKREWANLVLKNMKADADPKTESTVENGWTATGGGSAVDSDAGKAFALLTVISGGGRTVSILSVFNDQAYLPQVAAFGDSIDLGKAVADAPPPQFQNGSSSGLRQLTIADIAGEWGETAGINTRYVDRATGVYAGADSVHFTSKMTFTADGGYADDFFGLENGRKIKANTTGTVSIVGQVLTIKRKGLAKYVIRGWQEFTNMTVLNVCGPWYDDQPIP